MQKTTLTTLALTLALLLSAGIDASACPNCKEAIAAQPEEAGRLREGYFYSIIGMVTMPFAMIGTGAFVVARAVKRGTLPPL
jgi:hypothetical protein